MSDVESSGLARGRKAPRVVTLVIAASLAAATPARAQGSDDGPRAQPVPAEVLARAASFDVATRQGALASLQALGTPAAFQLALVMLQRDLDPRVRATAAAVLGAPRDPDFIPALTYASNADPAPEVRAAATASLEATAPFAKRPKLAAGFSVLCPGCGYFYLGQPQRAAAFLGATAGLVAAGILVLEESPRASDGSHDSGRATPLLIAGQDLWFYGVFASYRDARLARGDRGARYPVAREHLGDLLLAPFNPHVLKSPWVWAGLPLMLGAATAASYAINHAEVGRGAVTLRTLGDGGGVQFFGRHYSTAPGVALGETYDAVTFLPVGVGEEALFRGVVQAGLSETPLGLWGGWAVGSVIFGAAHTFNFIGEENGVKTAALAVPYLILTGSYLGLVYVKSDFSLLRSTALHFWYDFLISTLDFIANPDDQPFVARFAMPF
jgi:membrane protease YdiL (CAAX protease family)